MWTMGDTRYNPVRAPIEATMTVLLSNTEHRQLMEAERPAFEKWAGDYGRIFHEREGDGYKFPYTQEAWVGWLARAALTLIKESQ